MARKTSFHVDDAIPVATHHHAFVFGLAFIDALHDKGEVVDFLAFDGLVLVVLPSSGERETRIAIFRVYSVML